MSEQCFDRRLDFYICGINSIIHEMENYDVTYALYTDKKSHIQWTKEEDENIPEAHRGTREQITRTFSNLDQGVFIQTNEFEGYIEYQSTDEPESKSGFQMIKDEDGIWNVAFKPIQ